MNLIDEVKEIIQIFAGQNSAMPHGLLKKEDAEEMVNFVCRKGRLRKIWGAPIYAQPVVGVGSGGITWIEYFKKRFLYQQGTQVAIETAEDSAVFSGIGEILLGDANKIRSEKWRNRVFLTNGVENKFFEDAVGTGEAFLTLGLFPPGAGAIIRGDTGGSPVIALVESGGGTLADATLYSYLITFYDESRQVESLPYGAYVDEDGLWTGKFTYGVTTTAANKKLTGTVTTIKALGYDVDRVSHFKVYRATQADPTVYKAIINTADDTELFPIADNTFIDADGDEQNLGSILDESISPPPSGKFYNGDAAAIDYSAIGPRFVKFFRDQIWKFGVRYPGLEDPSHGTADIPTFQAASGIAYSSQVGKFDYFQDTYDVGRATDQEDTGMAKFRNTLFFFKQSSTYYLDGTNPENYQIRELDPRVGIVAPDSIQETGIGVIGLSANGFVLYDSASPAVDISEKIFDKINKINFAQADKFHSAFNEKEGKYECYITEIGSDNINQVYVYDINLKSWSFLKTRIGGASAYGRDSSRRQVGLLGDSQNSRLYDLVDYDETQFRGEDIRSRWLSKHFDFGHPDKLKRVQYIQISARSKTEFRLDVSVIADFGQQETLKIEGVTSDTDFPIWATDAEDEDGMTWDLDSWAGDAERCKITIPIQALARNVQILIQENESDADLANFEIEEIVIGANLLGSD